ncbi:MAG: aminopeptidase P family protein [Bacteroidota bacterium]
MKYSQLPKEQYINARASYIKNLKPKSLAVFNSNDIMPTNADGHMPFRQNNDLFWLSGVDQEESILVLFPDCFTEKHREVLFLKKTSEEIAIWEGAKLNKDQAYEVSGIKTVYWLDQFEKVFQGLMSEAENIYLNTNEHTRAQIEVETRDARFVKNCKAAYPGHHYERSAPFMHQLRSVKSQFEIDQMRKACDITKAGIERVMRYLKPGVMEFELEAELAHEFLRRGSRGFAYTPIIASGFSACVLHYIENDKACKDGDVILMDVGAEYGNYASDLTRSLPVNGRYTDRQKQVYNAVLRVMKACYGLLRPGVFLHDYHKQVGELMEKELVDLGLISMDDIRNQDPNWPAYKKYFMHGTSHFIGLDVHDVGLWTEPIQAGNVFTVEPGIYIREENLGIRIENDIVITENGVIDLMETIPIEVEEIEEMMNAGVPA